MKFHIVSDSSCDLGREEAERLGVSLVSFYASMGDERSYREERDIPTHQFYQMMADAPGVFPKTSMPTLYDYGAAFSGPVKKGLPVLCLCLNAAFSGACQTAANAAALMQEEFPGSKIHVMDSQLVTVLQGLLVQHKAQIPASQQLAVGGVQIVGHHPDPAFAPLVLNGPADAPLAVGGDIDAGQGRVFPKSMLGNLVGVIVPVEAGLKGEELDVPLPRKGVQKAPKAAVMGTVVDMPRNGENQPAAGQHLAHKPRRRLSRPVTVHPHKAEPLAVRSVGIEGHHRNALFMEQVDAPDQVRGVIGGNSQAACPPVYQLVDLPEDLGRVPALNLPDVHL